MSLWISSGDNHDTYTHDEKEDQDIYTDQVAAPKRKERIATPMRDMETHRWCLHGHEIVWSMIAIAYMIKNSRVRRQGKNYRETDNKPVHRETGPIGRRISYRWRNAADRRGASFGIVESITPLLVEKPPTGGDSGRRQRVDLELRLSESSYVQQYTTSTLP